MPPGRASSAGTGPRSGGRCRGSGAAKVSFDGVSSAVASNPVTAVCFPKFHPGVTPHARPKCHSSSSFSSRSRSLCWSRTPRGGTRPPPSPPWRLTRHRLPRSPRRKASATTLGRHRRLLDTVERRLDPKTATGLALTIALGMVFVGRAPARSARLPDAVERHARRASTRASARWGADHAGDVSERGLEPDHEPR